MTKRPILSVIVTVLFLALVCCGIWHYEANQGFTPWMDDEAFHDWRAAALDHQPYYLTAIEGRTVAGHIEWRVRLAPKPQHVKWSWKWFSQMDEKSYREVSQRVTSQERYKQIWTQSFKDPAGQRIYNVIFLHIQSAN